MKKSLLAVALAATLGLAACGEEAKASEVRVYGTMEQAMEWTNGAADIKDGDTQLGVKVKEDLGNGSSAFVKIRIDLDTDNSGSQSTKEAYMGLTDGTTTIDVGRNKDLTKRLAVVDAFQGNSYGATNGDRRDSIVAVTSKVGDFKVGGSMIVDAGGEDVNDVYEVMGGYGPVSVVYQKNETTGADTTMAALKTELAGIKVLGTHELLTDDNTVTTVVGIKDFGANTVRVGYESVEGGDNTARFEVAHNFSKKTSVYLNVQDKENTDNVVQLGMQVNF